MISPYERVAAAGEEEVQEAEREATQEIVGKKVERKYPKKLCRHHYTTGRKKAPSATAASTRLVTGMHELTDYAR